MSLEYSYMTKHFAQKNPGFIAPTEKSSMPEEKVPEIEVDRPDLGNIHLSGSATGPDLKGKGVGSPTSKESARMMGGRQADATRSWSQVVQGTHRFRETSQATDEEFAELEQRFNQVVVFNEEDIDQASNRWKSALVNKFLGQGFSLDFIQKEMKLWWNIQGNLHVSSLLEGLLLFDCPSEEVKQRILNKGPWSLAGQLLALESWRPGFQLGRDIVKQARIQLRFPDLPLELWDKEKILKIVALVGVPFFLDEQTETSVRMGYARVCVLMDVSKSVCPGAKLWLKDKSIWQQFTYEELSNLYYVCGKIWQNIDSCDCAFPG